MKHQTSKTWSEAAMTEPNEGITTQPDDKTPDGQLDPKPDATKPGTITMTQEELVALLVKERARGERRATKEIGKSTPKPTEEPNQAITAMQERLDRADFKAFALENGLTAKAAALLSHSADLKDPDSWSATLTQYQDVFAPAKTNPTPNKQTPMPNVAVKPEADANRPAVIPGKISPSEYRNKTTAEIAQKILDLTHGK